MQEYKSEGVILYIFCCNQDNNYQIAVNN